MAAQRQGAVREAQLRSGRHGVVPLDAHTRRVRRIRRPNRSWFDEHDYGLWAVEVQGQSDFIGYVGLVYHDFPAHFTPAVEIGWRLDRAHWGHGLAIEAATAAVADGFERAGLDEIVSFTATINVRFRRVMEKLGMTRDPADDLDHPRVPMGHRLRRHVLYRLSRPDA